MPYFSYETYAFFLLASSANSLKVWLEAAFEKKPNDAWNIKIHQSMTKIQYKNWGPSKHK